MATCLRPNSRWMAAKNLRSPGIYWIGPNGVPYRLGYALGNEFSDHVMERQNYLYLAHSKLRACSIGPALRLGALPAHVEGMSRILRDGKDPVGKSLSCRRKPTCPTRSTTSSIPLQV